MSKIIILRLSMAPTSMNVCSVSDCFATHSCGMSSRARTEEEDRLSTNSTLCVIYCTVAPHSAHTVDQLQCFYIINTSQINTIALSRDT